MSESRAQMRRKQFKKVGDADESRRKREEFRVELRQTNKSSLLMKKRREGMQGTQGKGAAVRDGSAGAVSPARLCCARGDVGGLVGSVWVEEKRSVA